jgi:hypothetical protein
MSAALCVAASTARGTVRSAREPRFDQRLGHLDVALEADVSFRDHIRLVRIERLVSTVAPAAARTRRSAIRTSNAARPPTIPAGRSR